MEQLPAQWLACGVLQNSHDQVVTSELFHSQAFIDREAQTELEDGLNALVLWWIVWEHLWPEMSCGAQLVGSR